MKMTSTLDYVAYGVLPIAASLLPPTFDTPGVRAMLLAIGLQESGFAHRRQYPTGPAHGFWQFEKNGGVRGVVTSLATGSRLLPVLDLLHVPADVDVVHQAIVDNDVLAAVLARLLLYTVAGPPRVTPDREDGWLWYLNAWRPGTPRPEAWAAHWHLAWAIIDS